MPGTKLAVGRPPNFIRKLCAERFIEALPLLDRVIWGGLRLDPRAAERLGLDQGEGGAELVATVKERLAAIELLARVGVGFRTDHAADRGPAGEGVVLLPPWDDEVGEYEVIEPAEPRQLGDGAEPQAGS